MGIDQRKIRTKPAIVFSGLWVALGAVQALIPEKSQMFGKIVVNP